MRGEMGEFVELLPASQRTEKGWYAGTADAVYQNIDILRNYGPKYIVILAGDHIYKMDYGDMLAEHVAQNANMTIGCLTVSLEEAKAFGVMSCDESHRIIAFDEKPENPNSMPGSDDIALASMGIYIFNAEFLYEQLIKDTDTPNSTNDFGHDIIPSLIEKYKLANIRFSLLLSNHKSKKTLSAVLNQTPFTFNKLNGSFFIISCADSQKTLIISLICHSFTQYW